MPHQLPPLNALRVFEVAARTASFTEAAKELHLTHGAVSRQIQRLEEELGQSLFRKEGQRMVATMHAKAFAREISLAFDHIGDAAARYGKISKRKIIRVNAPATFAMRWLIPRLADFRGKHSETEVRVSTALSSDPVFKGSFDIVIRRSPGDQSQFEVVPLFTEHATLIASPALLKKIKLRRAQDVTKAMLLATETRPGDWERWWTAASIGPNGPVQQLRFDHFFVTLQAVADGLGIGIGSFPTLSADEVSGRIARPFPDIKVPGDTYVALIPLDSDKPRHLRDFQTWLLESAEQSGD